MILQPKNWLYKTPSPELVEQIAGHLKISRAASAVLVNRGIASLKEAEAFLYPRLDALTNPFLLPDIVPAIERIRRAVDGREKILVYGDRDVDGVTSISIMVRTLRSLGADVVWYIPSDEGYGVHTSIIERYVPQGIRLIITVDCGISAVEETRYAAERGIDTVITDHHEPPSTGIPAAVAVVDPKRPESKYPFSDLAGCSVSFKVAEALMMSFGRYFNEEFVALAAVRDGNGQVLAARKIKNGLALDSWTGRSAADGAPPAALSGYIGARRVILHPYDGCRALLERCSPGNEIVDLAERAKAHYPLSVASLEQLAGDMKLDLPLATAEERAAAAAEIFVHLENLADLRMSFFQTSHMDVITLGTIADIMPLVRENRTMVKHGLRNLAQSKKVGVQALLERCLNKNRPNFFSAKSVSWSITPILNAAGRRGRADLSAELLLTEDAGRASALLDEIFRLNAERKELQAENLEKFMPLLAEQCDLEHDRIFVVTASGIEHGVTGIIASQIMRQYCRPTILLIIEKGEAMGAARSIGGFDIVGALDKVKDLLVKYGGHSQAAGLTLAAENLDEFRRRIKEIAEKDIAPEMLVPVLELDADLQVAEVSLDFLRELAELEPCGMGNPHPLFGLRKMKIKEHSRVGTTGDHLRLRLCRNGSPGLAAIGWGMGSLEKEIAEYELVDVAVQLELNVWQDKQSVQLLIQDIKPSEY